METGRCASLDIEGNLHLFSIFNIPVNIRDALSLMLGNFLSLIFKQIIVMWSLLLATVYNVNVALYVQYTYR